MNIMSISHIRIMGMLQEYDNSNFQHNKLGKELKGINNGFDLEFQKP